MTPQNFESPRFSNIWQKLVNGIESFPQGTRYWDRILETRGITTFKPLRYWNLRTNELLINTSRA